MINKQKLNRLEQVQAKTLRQAQIAAINKLKQWVVYQWQQKSKPAMLFFNANNVDENIVNQAVTELMEQYPGVYFVPTNKDKKC